MDLIQVLNELVASVTALQSGIATLQTQLVDAQAQVDIVAKAKYDEGFAAGVASVPVTPGGFTQEQLDAAVSAALVPVQAELEACKVELAAVKAELEAMKADMPNQLALAKEDGKKELKAELKQKYVEQQVVETAGETGFAALLD